MVAEWVKDKIAKYKLINNTMVVHVLKKATDYKEKKRTLYKLQKIYLFRKNGKDIPLAKDIRKRLLEIEKQAAKMKKVDKIDAALTSMQPTKKQIEK